MRSSQRSARSLGFAAAPAVLASGRVNALLFALAFVAAQTATCVLFVLLADVVSPTRREHAVLELAFGGVLVAGGVLVRRRGTVRAADLALLDRLTPATAAAAAVALNVGPKRLVLTALAAPAIDGAASLAVLYLAVATLLVWAPVLAFELAGERAVRLLARGSSWLAARQRSVASASLVGVGALAVADSLASLLEIPGMDEAKLERTEHGLVPQGEGWFTLNLRDAAWRAADGRGAFCEVEGAQDFSQLGFGTFVLQPGDPMSMYHWESDQEDFLVVAGEAVLIVEGEERPLRTWDFVHCPPGAKHVIVGAGGGPCVVVAVGARVNSVDSPDWGGYTVDEAALRYGAGVSEATTEPSVAYANGPKRQPTAYRDGWLPDSP
jgi:uncharacterized cupin superfamily protein